MQKKILFLLVVLALSSGVVILLALISDDINHKHNPFVRLFPPHPTKFLKSLNLKYNSYYIAGASGEHIYLGNKTAPLHLVTTNHSLTDSQHIKLHIKNIAQFQFKNIRVAVDSPNFYITDGILPGIFKGCIDEWTATKSKYDSAYFTQLVPIGSNSFALKSVNRVNENILVKEDVNQPYIKTFPKLLEKQVDGLFCTDGTLNYDPQLAWLVYVYHYRNQFICMDTNFNLIYKGNTIDTNRVAKIEVAKIRSDNAVTLSKPPLLVNKRSCLSGNYLFVQSNLQAKNENIESFNKAAVVDVYAIKDGSYQFSFYLWNYGGKKVDQFYIYKDQLFALFDKYLVMYELQRRHFPLL